ncbi:hypothetical protein BU16DRAFT_562134 [Lophium mytilinum]|uniref:Uncharacterized protein n=1 Tax=Lophium mytilinum TaxID=390894 RepID=A0A6A6QQR2_9PEZI|nr:hypothetical protein BU16DRAFT_562134 [Lophium mytilinum]
MAANATMHWLLSESVFIISTVAYLPNYVEDPGNSYTVSGYSNSATVISICFGAGIVLTLLLVSCKRISHDIPLASTYSIAISAACHRPQEDKEASLLPVQWGVITSGNQTPVRCAFTTLRTVRPPQAGDEIGG